MDKLKEDAIQFSLMPKTLEEEYHKDFPLISDGLVRGTPGGFVLSPLFAQHVDELRKFEIRKDDVWIVTFPKCGTTWMQELVWLVMNNCKFEEAQLNLNRRVPFFEFPFMPPKHVMDELWKKVEQGLDTVTDLNAMAQMKSPRIMKSHLPLYLLPPTLLDTAKVVYVARNPKDVIVSYYYHHKLIKYMNFTGDMDTFAEYFINDEVSYAPYFPHLLEAWNLRHHPNLKFIFFEDLKKDLRGSIVQVAEFLGKTLSDQQLEQLTEHLKFETLSQNEAVNKEAARRSGFFREGRFMRKGKTGDWKNHFSAELSQKVDGWIKKNLEGTDLEFVDDLSEEA